MIGNSSETAATLTVNNFDDFTYAGTDFVKALVIGSVSQPDGEYGSSASGADNGGQGVGVFDDQFAGTGTTTVGEPAGYSGWTSGFPTLSNTDQSLDFDLGGLETGIEYVVGGDPTDGSDDASLAPTPTRTGTDLIFEFRRTPLANNDQNTTIIVEYDSDLNGWKTAVDTDPGVNITVNTGFYGDDDQVVVSFAESLTASGKLFDRLRVEISIP